MGKKLERKIIWTLVLLLIIIGLNGCGTKTIKTVGPETEVNVLKEKEPTTLETIGKLDGIVNALGCVFAPETCSKSTKPGQN